MRLTRTNGKTGKLNPNAMRSFFARNSPTGVIGFCFLTAMALVAFGFFAHTMYEGWASRPWPVADGMVLSSEVRTHTTENRTSYSPIIHYKYQVHGKWYTGSRLAFGFSNRSREASSDIVEGYAAGTSIPVHYDPNQPENSVLQPGVHSINWLAFVFGAAALGMAFLLRFNDVRAQAYKRQPPGNDRHCGY
jgi:hypothetical protein